MVVHVAALADWAGHERASMQDRIIITRCALIIILNGFVATLARCILGKERTRDGGSIEQKLEKGLVFVTAIYWSFPRFFANAV